MKKVKIFLLAAAAFLLLTSAMKEARGSNFVILRGGTPVVIELAEDFDAASMKEGAKVPMVVAEKVKNEGLTLIDAGTPVEASFLPGGKETDGAGFLRISSVRTTDGQDVMVRVTPETPEAEEDKGMDDRSLMLLRQANRSMAKGTVFKVYLADTYFVED